MSFMEIFHNVHLIGAGGIGLSAVGKLLIHRGKRVTGSDMNENEQTAELVALGALIRAGHTADNLPPDTDLVVYSDAIPPDNPERVAAHERGVLQMSYFDFLGRFSAQRKTIAVSGTNGKSTTTAMLGAILVQAELNPTVIVGSRLKSFPDGNLRVGGDLTVIEACEYRANMLKLMPQIIALTDIRPDHLDFYRDFDDIKETFQHYVDGLPDDGLLIYNSDDPASALLKHPARSVSYSIDSAATYQAVDLAIEGGRQKFTVMRAEDKPKRLGEFSLSIPGRFNVYNALAAMAVAFELGVKVTAIKDAFDNFTGIWRRFEVLGGRAGAVIVSDYAHHPDAIRGTIQAARDFFPERRIVACFQPHHRNRTENLFDEFVGALAEADLPLVTDIYEVAGREEQGQEKVSGASLAEAVAEKKSMSANEIYVGEPNQALEQLKKIIKPDDLVLIMGAGDIYKIASKLVIKK